MDKLTQKSKEALKAAQELARENSHQELDGVHLASILAQQTDTIVPTLLQRLGVDLESLNDDFNLELNRRAKVEGANSSDVFLSGDLKKSFDIADDEAKKLQDEYLSAEHLLLGLLECGSNLKRIFSKHGIERELLLEKIEEVRGNQRVTDENPEDKFEALEKYGQDLTQLAREGKIDPVIGRNDEIRRVMQVLMRRTKNNPALIGEPGVGKTAIAEGLARRIISGDVPDSLKNKKLIAMDLSAMIAGAKYRGEFEDRLKAFLKEVAAASGEIILFIDELHTLIGAGNAEGSADAANMLKPQLARGELRCIGATTLDEYRKHIEKDPALERRFQPVKIIEPTVEETVAILRGLKERYEVHHGTRIQDGALISAAKLSHRYITDRFLPDKAIDLVDEAASRLRLELDSMPAEIDKYEREILQLEVEETALKKEKDDASKERLKELKEQLSNLKEEANKLKAQWQGEKAAIDAVAVINSKLEKARQEQEVAERASDLSTVAEIQYGRIPELEQKLEKLEQATKENQRGKLLNEEVSEEDIACVVATWTGIPVDRMLEGEKQKLVKMEERLHKRVIGQEEAVEAVANAVRRARSGLQDAQRPMGSFIFLGPTGVGKTELARSLADFLFDDESAMTRIDMSEYMEKHSVSRLIGAPPGYVGYDEGGQLSESVRRKPYSVILFDEIEKAHPDVFNVLLQVLDDGRLTDGQGRTVDFRNAVIIMTSNIGSDIIQEHFKSRNDVTKGLQEKVIERLKRQFRPEFLNRVDDNIVFGSLTKNQLGEIVDIQLDRVDNRLEDQKLSLNIDDSARSLLIEEGYDPQFGARPLKRVIQRRLLDPLALKLLDGEFKAGDMINAGVNEDDIEFSLVS